MMKFDHALLTGLFLGATIGLHFADKLVAYMPFFLLAAVVYLMGYMHHSK
ncbi:MAG: hypothetical protein HZC17_09035 [Candidatus Omnitrophica bacterium]|nr:hypothetical protein [Candidatus Omnitrophota bacterium]